MIPTIRPLSRRGESTPAVVDGTTEAEIAVQQQEDDAEAMQDMARVHTPRPTAPGAQPDGDGAAHRRAARDDPQLGTGEALSTGAARALLRVLDKAPETALRVLT